MAKFTDYMSSTSQIKTILFPIITWLACGKGYTGPNCDIKCPYPLYGVDCQMRCNCIEKVCDPVNGCNITSTGVYMFLIELNLVCHLPFYTKVCKVSYLSLILEYPMTSLMGFEDKFVTTELMSYEASISESNHFD